MTTEEKRESLKALLDASAGEGEMFELLALSGGEITPEIEERLQKLALAIPQKVDAYRNFQRNLSARLENLTNHITELTRLKKSLSLVSDRADRYLFDQMKNHGLSILEGNTTKYRIVPCAKRTVIDDESKIPAKYKTIVQTEVIDKATLKEDLEAGSTVEGAHLEGGESLRSYTKV